jgi:predicted transcriptional regulator of viral defense system
MKNISKQEGQLIHHFSESNQPCFTNPQARQAFPYLSKSSVEKLLNSMVHKELLMHIKKGMYYLIPYEQSADSFMPDWHLLAPYLVKDQPYYVGYYAALQIHGLTTQPSLKEKIVVNHQIRPTILTVKGISFQFIYHNSNHFFGYRKTWIDAYHQVNCSDIEKTIIDALFQPGYAGGIIEIAKALYLSKKQLDVEKLFNYSQQFQSKAVIKRLGFLLELLEIEFPNLERLQSIRTPSIVALDPEVPSTGKIITRWSIQQNVDSQTILSSLHT